MKGRFALICTMLCASSASVFLANAAEPEERSTPKHDIEGVVKLAKPSPAQYVYHEQERIMFVCLDPCSWQGREYDNHSTDLKDMKLPNRMRSRRHFRMGRLGVHTSPSWGTKCTTSVL